MRCTTRACFMRTHTDHLVLGPFMLDTAEQSEWKEATGRVGLTVGLAFVVFAGVVRGAVYFLVLTPTGVVRRLVSRSGLTHPAGETGYWADRRTTPRSTLTRQF